MRIDYDLLRDILKQVADCEDARGVRASCLKHTDGISDGVLLWHIKILFDNDFLDGKHVAFIGGEDYFDMRFTLKGQEFFDSISSNKIWNKIKEKAKIIGAELSIEFIKQVMPVVLKDLLK